MHSFYNPINRIIRKIIEIYIPALILDGNITVVDYNNNNNNNNNAISILKVSYF